MESIAGKCGVAPCSSKGDSRPAASEPPGSLLDMPNPRTHPSPTESESTFNEVAQVIRRHGKL